MLIYVNGLILGLSLIMALGPQNVFLIKQGAQRNHPGLSAVVCFICDIILICASISGLHRIIEIHPAIQSWMIWLGSAFLLFYATKALRSAFKPQNTEEMQANNQYTKIQIILFALGFSLLNPHAIIDSLVIIGSGSAQYPDHHTAFLCGVISASFIWFSTLTITTRYFSDVLTKVRVWQTIEFLSGIIMVIIGIKLMMTAI